MAAREAPRGPATPPGTLPTAIRRRAIGVGRWAEHRIRLRTISPLYGGGTRPRATDTFEPIRGPGVRGHLRFWWRATQGHRFDDPQALAAAEKAIFGGVGGSEVARSAVEVLIAKVQGAEARMTHGELQPGGQYVLWIAAANRQQAAADMVKPGLTFDLHLSIPTDHEEEVLTAARAWIRFGGYGGRTRRGAGSLTVLGDDAARWLPTGADRGALLGDLLGEQLGAEPPTARDLPLLAGAGLAAGRPTAADKAFEAAAGWLRDFRQGAGGRRGEKSDRSAREPGMHVKDKRLGQSRWPEADKVRQLSHGRTDHPPRHGADPAWPRAGLGLPIIGQFQRRARGGGTLREPDDFELRWRERGDGKSPGPERDRLASPLIVKPLALADGRCVPLALWLHRAYPDGEVILHRHPATDASAASFDRLLGAGDDARFGPLALGEAAPEGQALRTAFFYWLGETRRAQELV